MCGSYTLRFITVALYAAVLCAFACEMQPNRGVGTKCFELAAGCNALRILLFVIHASVVRVRVYLWATTNTDKCPHLVNRHFSATAATTAIRQSAKPPPKQAATSAALSAITHIMLRHIRPRTRRTHTQSSHSRTHARTRHKHTSIVCCVPLFVHQHIDDGQNDDGDDQPTDRPTRLINRSLAAVAVLMVVCFGVGVAAVAAVIFHHHAAVLRCSPLHK